MNERREKIWREFIKLFDNKTHPLKIIKREDDNVLFEWKFYKTTPPPTRIDDIYRGLINLETGRVIVWLIDTIKTKEDSCYDDPYKIIWRGTYKLDGWDDDIQTKITFDRKTENIEEIRQFWALLGL